MSESPQPRNVIELCRRLFKSPVRSIARFPTGLCHHVYDVVLENGERTVVRMCGDDKRSSMKGGIYWSGILRAIGVPLPELRFAEGDGEPFAYMVLERLAGTDLGHVYSALGGGQKRKLVEELVAIQLRVAGLPRGKGFGFAFSMDGPFRHSSWREVLEEHLRRSRQWTEAAGIVGTGHLTVVEKELSRLTGYFSSVAPVPFLDDITTKNVLISDG
jgi:hypothetical protein